MCQIVLQDMVDCALSLPYLIKCNAADTNAIQSRVRGSTVTCMFENMKTYSHIFKTKLHELAVVLKREHSNSLMPTCIAISCASADTPSAAKALDDN